MKLRRPFSIVLWFVGSLFLVGGAVLVWLLGTQSGARFVMGRMTGISDGMLSVGVVSGRLSDEIVLGDLRVSGDGVDVAVDRVAIEIATMSLFSGVVELESLSTSLVRVLGVQAPAAGAVSEESSESGSFGLPVELRLRRGSFEGFEIGAGEDALVLGRTVLSARARGQGAEIQRFEVRWQDMFFSVQGDFDWGDGFAYDALLSWSGELNGETLLGSAGISGLWPRLELDAELLEPVSASASGELLATDAPTYGLTIREPSVGEVSISGGFDAVANVWRVDVTADSIDPGAYLAGGPDALSVAGSLTVSLADTLRLTAETLSFEAAFDADTLTGRFRGAYVPADALEIDELVVELRDNRLVVAGVAGATVDLTLEAELRELGAISGLIGRIPGVTPELVDWVSALSGGATAELAVIGDRQFPAISGSVGFDAARFFDLPLTAVVEFARSGATTADSMIVIERLDAALGGSRVSVTGRIESRPGTADLDLGLALDDLEELTVLLMRLDPSRTEALNAWLDSISGRAEARLRIEGLALAGDLSLSAISGEIEVEDARLLDLPLEASVDFSAMEPLVPDSRIEIERLAASVGENRVSAEGSLATVGGDADLDVDLVLDDLAQLAGFVRRLDLPAIRAAEEVLGGLAGALTASVTLSGDLRAPDVDGRLVALPLSYGDRTVSRVELVSRAGFYAGADSRIDLSVDADGWSASLEAGGVFDNGEWAGNLSALAIDEQYFGLWELSAPVALTLGANGATLAETCLANGGSRVCLDGRYGGQNDRVRISSTDFELAVLNPILPDSIALTGRVTTEASLEYQQNRPLGSLTARGQDIGVAVEISETDGVTTFLDTLTVDAELDGVALGLAAVIESTTSGRVEFALETTDVTDPDGSLSGRADIVWPELAAVSLLSPDVGEVTGRLEVSVDVAGTMNAPEFGGSASLDSASVSIPEWGVVVDRISAAATSFDGGSLEFGGSGYIDDGELRWSGRTALDPAAGWPTELSLTGDALTIVRRSDATLVASPDLNVRVLLPSIEVTGNVLIPEASIAVEEVPPQAVSVSPDSVLHGSAAPESARPLQLAADVTIELGDDVRYTGSGLNTDLSGALRLAYQPGVTPTASGSLSLVGSYEAYGQTLSLERGELLFAGPLTDPAVDVLAVREIGSTTVGVRLSGTLQSPAPSLYSDPPMSEANALSYLVLGRPLSDSNDAEAATLQSTAVALGLQQALPVVQRVGETLGLDELSIEPTDLDAGALMAGKYLSPKLYMSYTYGLFNRLGGFLLRYDISERLSLETRSGNEKSMDLLYSIEKD